MLYGGRYVPENEIFSVPNVAEFGKPTKKNENIVISNETPYPYPARKPSISVPPFRVKSVLRSLNVNPAPLLQNKTPMELHRARVRITENEIGHSLNEASKKFFGNAFPLPIRNRSTIIPHSTAKFGIPTNNMRSSDGAHERTRETAEFEIEIDEDGDENVAKSSKQNSFAVRKETFPAVVLLKTKPIAPLRLQSPRPQPKYQRRRLEPTRLEDLNVINGYTHINTDGRHETNTFATAVHKKHHRQDRDSTRETRMGAVSGRFHAEIDLTGFLENEIFFQTDDSSLLVIGLREKRDGLNARKVTEVLEFPEGVYPESLCISRTSNGTLIMEQHF